MCMWSGSKRVFWIAIGVLLSAVWMPAQDNTSKAAGEAVYKQRCAGCHDQVSERIPPKTSLNQMPSARILRALDWGAMMTVAYPMSREDRQAVAAYLGTNAPAIKFPASAYCSNHRATVSDHSKFSWNGWSP